MYFCTAGSGSGGVTGLCYVLFVTTRSPYVCLTNFSNVSDRNSEYVYRMNLCVCVCICRNAGNLHSELLSLVKGSTYAPVCVRVCVCLYLACNLASVSVPDPVPAF